MQDSGQFCALTIKTPTLTLYIVESKARIIFYVLNNTRNMSGLEASDKRRMFLAFVPRLQNIVHNTECYTVCQIATFANA